MRNNEFPCNRYAHKVSFPHLDFEFINVIEIECIVVCNKYESCITKHCNICILNSLKLLKVSFALFDNVMFILSESAYFLNVSFYDILNQIGSYLLRKFKPAAYDLKNARDFFEQHLCNLHTYVIYYVSF